jgi:hypothetical protein
MRKNDGAAGNMLQKTYVVVGNLKMIVATSH